MYEKQQYEIILNRILKRLPDDEDKRPSSPIYIAVAPAAKELETVYGEMDYTLEQTFPTTAGREYLIKNAETYNLAPNPATKSVIEGEFDVPIDIGTRFTRDGIGFRVIKEVDKASINYYYYTLECDEYGEIGNVLSGTLVPDWNIQNLKHAAVTKLIIPGEEEESTEDFRARFLASFRSKSFGGNLSDYFDYLNRLDGVGRVKILRCIDKDGSMQPGCVTVVFTDSSNNKPSDELVAIVQESLQPLNEDGEPDDFSSGLGIAPIGHTVYVRGVETEAINIEVSLIFQDGFDWETLQSDIERAINEYFEELAEAWGDISVTESARYPMRDRLTILRSNIEGRLVDIEGILDANETKINGMDSNYYCQWDKIPVLESVKATKFTAVRTVTCAFNCPDCIYDKNALICPRVKNG